MVKNATPIIGIDASRMVSHAITGTEAYSLHLTRALLEKISGEQTRLYFRSVPDEDLAKWLATQTQNESVAIPFPRLWTHIRLSWEMLRKPPDVLFVPAHVLPIIRPTRTLVTIHDLGYLRFPEAHPSSQRRYLDTSTRWNARVATHILADSIATRDAIVEAYHVNPSKISVVYPGYSQYLKPERDPARINAVREKYSLPKKYILYIGRIQPRKNLARLVEAFAKLAQEHPRLGLVLAGPTGWLAEPIVQQAERSGLAERIIFPGYIDEEDKATLISGAQVFAYPSLYEGFGFPALEAQACETPLLTSNTSSLPEVAGEGALLVDPEDTDTIAGGLQRLLSDNQLRADLVEKGLKNISRFSWEKAAEQTYACIKELLAS